MDKAAANYVYIATSLDGYIADRDGGIDWLEMIPNPDGDDMGYHDFLASVDALVMGRVTFATVCNFDVPWPYAKPVYVLSRSMREVPPEYAGKAFPVSGPLPEVLAGIHRRGHRRLYVDGGTTIQSFLREDLIDEMILTTLPVLLGGGHSLFGELNEPLNFELLRTRTHLGQLVQRHYRRKR